MYVWLETIGVCHFLWEYTEGDACVTQFSFHADPVNTIRHDSPP